MTEEVSMFDWIINRIGKDKEIARLLRVRDEAFKTSLSAALGDAAPEDATDAAGFVAGVESLRMQLAEAAKSKTDATRGLNDRITELIAQRATAYDAERAATKRADDLLAEQQLIAEKLGLLEDGDEPAGPNVEGTDEMMDGVPGDGVQAGAGDPPAEPIRRNPGGQTDSEIAAEVEGEAMVNANREDQA